MVETGSRQDPYFILRASLFDYNNFFSRGGDLRLMG